MLTSAMNLFKYLEYRDILEEKIRENSNRRGYLTQIAKASRCQKSYLTLVRKRTVNFTPEHGIALCEFWGLSDLETDYFLELISFERAGLPALKQKIKKRLERIRKANDDLNVRYSQPKPQSSEIELMYYGNWLPSALHVMVGILKYRKAESIAAYLQLPLTLVLNTLEKLREFGFVKFADGMWLPAHGSIHLPRGSIATTLNHQNWRMRALLDSQKDNSGTHYTSVQTLSASDFEKINEMLQSFLDKQRSIVTQSPEEEVAVFCFDWFRL